MLVCPSLQFLGSSIFACAPSIQVLGLSESASCFLGLDASLLLLWLAKKAFFFVLELCLICLQESSLVSCREDAAAYDYVE